MSKPKPKPKPKPKTKPVLHAALRLRPEVKAKKGPIFRLPFGLSQELFHFVEPIAFDIVRLRQRTARIREKTAQLRERLHRGNQKRWRRWHRKQERHGRAIVRYPLPGQLCPFRCGPKRWAKDKCTERFRRVRHYRVPIVPQFPACETCGRSFDDTGLEVEEDSWSEDSERQRMEEVLERKVLKKLERKALVDENHVDPFLELDW